MKQRVRFTFPTEQIPKPLIHQLGKRFDVVTNIRRANVTADEGWVVLELEGESDEIAAGLRWIESQGVTVDPVEGDVLAD